MSRKIGVLLGASHGDSSNYHELKRDLTTKPELRESFDNAIKHMDTLKEGDLVALEHGTGFFGELERQAKIRNLKVLKLENANGQRRNLAYTRSMGVLQPGIGNAISKGFLRAFGAIDSDEVALEKIRREGKIKEAPKDFKTAAKYGLLHLEIRSDIFIRKVRKYKPKLVIVGPTHVGSMEPFLKNYRVEMNKKSRKTYELSTKAFNETFPDVARALDEHRKLRFGNTLQRNWVKLKRKLRK